MRVGTSLSFSSFTLFFEDHPHACGDKEKWRLKRSRAMGSSPCVWGQGIGLKHGYVIIGIIPMRVGTRCARNHALLCTWDHPHACGDKR